MILFALVVLVSVISINDVFGQSVQPDTIPPVLIIPENITFQLNKTSTVPVHFPYSVTATDNVGIRFQTCNPGSEFFNYGVTKVVCTALDEAGNISEASFTVTVLPFFQIGSAIADVIFKPNPVIFNEPFKVEIVFRNPVDGKILKNVSYSSCTYFERTEPCNMNNPIVDADGIVNQTAILKNDCCNRWSYYIQINGFANVTSGYSPQTMRIPINVESRDDDTKPELPLIPILNTDGEGYSDSLDPCPFTIATNCDSPKTIKVTLPLNFQNTANAWASGKITDNQFLQLAQIEINRGTMIIPDVKINGTGNSGAAIPSWVKTNAGWWPGTISDANFIYTIQFLFQEGILPVKVTPNDVPVQKPVQKPEPVPVSTKKIITVEESGFTQGCVKSGCYTPLAAKVSVGSVVTMTNTDTTGVHTFTSGTVDNFIPSPDGVFDSGVLMNGDSFTWKANVSGKVPYYCMLHTWMVGTIVVDGFGAVREPQGELVDEINSMNAVTYKIDGAHITQFNTDYNSMSVIFDVDVIENQGILEITFARDFFDAVFNGTDVDFIVVVDGDEYIDSEIKTTTNSRTLSIELPTGTQEIEIVGTSLSRTIVPILDPAPGIKFILQLSMENKVYDLSDTAVIDFWINGNTTKNVALEISDPRGTSIISRSFMVDSQGVSFEFRIDENFKTGTYKVVATTSDNGNTVTDTTFFKVKSQYNSFKITSVKVTDQQGNPSTLQAGEMGFIKVNLDATKAITTLVTVNLFDSDLTSIGIGSVKTTLSSGNSEIILSFMIPSDVAVGTSDIYVNAFSDWPSNGGIPLTSENSITENIE